MSYYISFNNGEKIVQISNFDQTVKKEINQETNKEQVVYQLTARISHAENYNSLVGTFDKYYKTEGISSLAVIDDDNNVHFNSTLYTQLSSENLFLDDEAEDLIYSLFFEMREDIKENS